jgi:transcriptional regulator of acetoin/glycerol metabolism
VVGVDDDVLAMFARHRWPGNFRQLSNVLRTASAMLDDDESHIGIVHLPQDFIDDLSDADAPCIRGSRLDDIAASAVSAALDAHGGNVSAAARVLGVSRTTVYRKMKG